MNAKDIEKPSERRKKSEEAHAKRNIAPEQPPERDEEIDYSDIPPLGSEFWRDAQVHVPPRKQQVTLRIDEDVLSWFRQGGSGYQTRMNAVLRAFMEHEKTKNTGTVD